MSDRARNSFTHNQPAARWARDAEARSVVRDINASGAIVLWDPWARILRIKRGRADSPGLTLKLRNRVAFRLEAILEYLHSEAFADRAGD